MRQVIFASPTADSARDSKRAAHGPKPVVLHVLEAFAGGTERHLVDLVRHIDGFDHVVAVPSRHHAVSTAEAADRLKHAGARIEQVEMGRSGAAGAHFQALTTLRRVLKAVQPDIVHGHSSVGGALARCATLGMSIPIVYTPHGFSRSGWALRVERLLSSRANRLIAVSPSERQFAEAHRLTDPQRVVVIPNGIDPDPPLPLAEPLRARLGLRGEVPIVGSVGRLARQKAPEVFVMACQIVHEAVPETHFVLIGTGPLRQQVERMLDRSGLGTRFHLIPHLSDAAAAIAEFDVFALSSRFEGAPYTPIEAMRAGTPVVVTDVAGNKDVVLDGVTGLVVPEDDPHGLAGGIIRLLRDDMLRESLTAAGRQAVSDYGVRDMAAATTRLYAELLA